MTRRSRGWLGFGGLLLLIAIGWGPAAVAQTSQPSERAPAVGEQRDPEPRRGWRHRHQERRGGRHGGLWALRGMRGMGRLFRPQSEDFAAARPGEDAQLLAFVERELPELDEVLSQFETARPLLFKRAMDRLRPHLRQLRRLHAEAPDLVRLRGRHMSNIHRGEMLQRAYRRGDEVERSVIEQEVRALIADNLEIQTSILRLAADHLEQTQAAVIDELFARLVDDDAEAAEYPPALRERVEAYRVAEDAARRSAIAEEIRAALRQKLERRIHVMRRRAEKSAAQRAEQVDRRLRRHLQRFERRADAPAP